MRNHDGLQHGGDTLERDLENALSALPPSDEIVSAVTPWHRAINRVLAGIALTCVTLNFLCLNYILPAIGIVLMLLGFRALRQENGWFRLAFVLCVPHSILRTAGIGVNASIWQNHLQSLPGARWLLFGNLLLTGLLLVCLRGGFCAVQEKAGLECRPARANMLIAWYAALCALGLIAYRGWFLSLAMIISYIFIIRSLFRLAAELGDAGYVISPAPLRLSDRALALLLTGLMTAAVLCGYVFFGSYPMDWSPVSTAEHAQVEALKQELLGLGFPETVLADLSDADILDCEGAQRVIKDSTDLPVNEGKIVTNSYQDSGGYTHSYSHTVYEKKELRLTGVAVQLPGEPEQWKIFHHFHWVIHPGFHGTESIQLWPPSRFRDGWAADGSFSGQVLYDKDGVVYAAPYYSLETVTYQSNSLFGGTSTQSDAFAAFSFPNSGGNHRGYLCYTATGTIPGYIMDSWINYTHQRSRIQYPVWTAMDYRISGGFTNRIFFTVQDALQFFASDQSTTIY